MTTVFHIGDRIRYSRIPHITEEAGEGVITDVSEHDEQYFINADFDRTNYFVEAADVSAIGSAIGEARPLQVGDRVVHDSTPAIEGMITSFHNQSASAYVLTAGRVRFFFRIANLRRAEAFVPAPVITSQLDLAAAIIEILATFGKPVVTGWKWNQSMVLFPEAKCPYCFSVIKSLAIWQITKTQLLGQAVPVHGRELVLNAPKHPHATPSDICFGNARGPINALFGGLNPNSVSCNIKDWLQGPYWNHECEEMEEMEEDDHDGQFYCDGCDRWCSDDDTRTYRGQLWCNDCFSDRTFYCDSCGDTQSNDLQMVFDDEYYCQDCFSERFFFCETCEEDYSRNDLRVVEDGSYCEGCFKDKCFTCTECGDDFEKGGHGEVCDDCYVELIDESVCAECGAAVVEGEGFDCDEATPCGRHYCAEHGEGDCVCTPEVTA